MTLDDDRAATDADLLHAVARGDGHAYASLYRRYSAILLGLLVRILGNRCEAEDVLQEVFLQIWRRAVDFDLTRGSPFRWLTMLARSRALDRRSTLDTRSRLLASEVAFPIVANGPDPSRDAALAEETRHLRQALGAIPDAQRRVLLLAYFEGLSQSEIATLLDAPLGTVKSHARLGLARLRALLRARDRGGREEDQ